MQLNSRRNILNAFQQPIRFLHRRVLLKVLHAAKRDGRVYHLEVIRIAAQGYRLDAVDVARLVEHEHEMREPLLCVLEMLCRELRPIRLHLVEVFVQERQYLVDQLEVCHSIILNNTNQSTAQVESPSRTHPYLWQDIVG